VRRRGQLSGLGRLVSAVLAAVLAGAGLTGCSGGSGGGAEPSRSSTSASQQDTPTAASATTAYPSGAPSGTLFTEPGSELALGESATIAWQPRQGVVGTLRIRVDRVRPTTFKKSFLDWRVDAATRTYAPYFVRAHVTNVGTTELGGFPVPLYGQSAADALVEAAVFKETFKPCHPSTLPKRFGVGETAAVCLVYLVPQRGQLVGAAFRPTQEFDPIVWRPVAPPVSPTTTLPSATTSPPS
jgi:hypothetical protein